MMLLYFKFIHSPDLKVPISSFNTAQIVFKVKHTIRNFIVGIDLWLRLALSMFPNDNIFQVFG